VSKKSQIAFVILLIAAIIAYGIFHRPQILKSDLPESSLPLPEITPSRSPSVQLPDETQVAKPPSVNDLREEVKQNVHMTPPSLIRFGADIGARMKAAKQNKAEAIKLLSELKTCASPISLTESPVQARALCIVSARELAQAWPELKATVDELVDGADAEAIGLASRIQ
jgi:hypothetical protein